MRDSTDPALQAGKRLAEVLRGQPAPVPHNDPLAQIVWATVMRSKQTFDAISHMVGNELDYQAAMLARPLFEDMVIAHWVDYNRDDPDWLVQRFFDHRDAMALDQKAMEKQVGWSLGTPLTSTPDKELRSRQNELGKDIADEQNETGGIPEATDEDVAGTLGSKDSLTFWRTPR
jgi:hypothetical protein